MHAGTPLRASWEELALVRPPIAVRNCGGVRSVNDNIVADALSRWAYPASKAFADVSIHGSAQDDADMQALIKQEWEEERGCYLVNAQEAINTLKVGVETKIYSIRAGKPHKPKHAWDNEPDLEWLEIAIRGIRTRSGATTGTEVEVF